MDAHLNLGLIMSSWGPKTLGGKHGALQFHYQSTPPGAGLRVDQLFTLFPSPPLYGICVESPGSSYTISLRPSFLLEMWGSSSPKTLNPKTP